MSVSCIRPPVGELMFQVYGRPLHPELFDIVAIRKIAREDYELTVRITRTGHLFSYQNNDIHLSEATSIADQELPEAKRLLHYKMRCARNSRMNCSSLRYESSFQVEIMAPEIFHRVHDEILADGSRRGMLHKFSPPGHDYTLPALGFISAEARIGCLIVTTFHTFPEEFTVIKTQSLIEKPALAPKR